MTEALLLDLSGVLYSGSERIPGALEALRRARAGRLHLRFVTNTSQKTRAALLAQLRGLGFELDDAELFTALDAACHWLRGRRLRPYCLVHADTVAAFAQFEQRDPNAVLVTDAGDGFSYEHLNRAFQLCLEGAPLLGIGRNRYYRAGDRFLLDAGPFIRAIEYAAGVEAVIVGKPGAAFFEQVVASTGVAPERTLMVGDDVHGDVAGALGAGIPACLVRTGKYRPGDEAQVAGEFAVVESIVEAVALALSA